ncbi:benzoate/H(+) symporter BenE family transporter [Roseomonas gilardii]|uniref:benzoate/H(+) symporter BenE family transporter n=1 Tax=Roseomonas gilardii TaxID=257708 RepID=UPI00119E7FF0|nr:benzoate/H(+) symporter BenE family transporter [Roseomonas gilardii]
MRDLLPPQTLAAGLLAAFVGFASSFAVVLNGLHAAGASPAQAASGLMALAVAMGLCGILLSLRSRMPVSVAWSTPGAALLASSGAIAGGFPVAVGAFLVSALLVVLAGWWKPLGRWVAAIPSSLASAMLAGVLFGLCLAPVRAVAQMPGPALAVIAAWAIAGRLHRLLAVPAAVIVAFGLILAMPGTPIAAHGSFPWPVPVPVMPQFTLQALIGTAIPLFLVTMASQNIPGLATLGLYGYRPAPGPLFRATGLFSVAAAFLGGHAVNLAAITAALCANEDAHPDPAQRWKAAVVNGLGYILFGLLAGFVTAFVAAAPVLVEAVAGLALLGALGGSLQGAMAVPEQREAAIVTLLVTASGTAFAGISGAFWGLLAGGAMLALSRLRRPPP